MIPDELQKLLDTDYNLAKKYIFNNLWWLRPAGHIKNMTFTIKEEQCTKDTLVGEYKIELNVRKINERGNN